MRVSAEALRGGEQYRRLWGGLRASLTGEEAEVVLMDTDPSIGLMASGNAAIAYEEDKLRRSMDYLFRRLKDFFPETEKSGIRIQPLRAQNRVSVMAALPRSRATICFIVEVSQEPGGLMKVVAVDFRYDSGNCPSVGTVLNGLAKLMETGL